MLVLSKGDFIMERLVLLLLGAVFVATEAKTDHTIEKRELLGYGGIYCLVAFSLKPRPSTRFRNVSCWGMEGLDVWVHGH